MQNGIEYMNSERADIWNFEIKLIISLLKK